MTHFFLLQATGVKLCAESKLSEPKVIDVVEMIPNKGALGKAFKKDASLITEAMAALSIDQVSFCSRFIKIDKRMGPGSLLAPYYTSQKPDLHQSPRFFLKARVGSFTKMVWPKQDKGLIAHFKGLKGSKPNLGNSEHKAR